MTHWLILEKLGVLKILTNVYRASINYTFCIPGSCQVQPNFRAGYPVDSVFLYQVVYFLEFE